MRGSPRQACGVRQKQACAAACMLACHRSAASRAPGRCLSQPARLCCAVLVCLRRCAPTGSLYSSLSTESRARFTLKTRRQQRQQQRQQTEGRRPAAAEAAARARAQRRRRRRRAALCTTKRSRWGLIRCMVGPWCGSSVLPAALLLAMRRRLRQPPVEAAAQGSPPHRPSLTGCRRRPNPQTVRSKDGSTHYTVFDKCAVRWAAWEGAGKAGMGWAGRRQRPQACQGTSPPRPARRNAATSCQAAPPSPLLQDCCGGDAWQPAAAGAAPGAAQRAARIGADALRRVLADVVRCSRLALFFACRRTATL